MPNLVPESGGLDPQTDHARPGDAAGGSARRQPTVDQGAGRGGGPEPQLGGADAVEKSTYVVGEGTEPDARLTGRYVARGAAGAGSIAVWIVGAVAALIALVYAIGIFA